MLNSCWTCPLICFFGISGGRQSPLFRWLRAVAVSAGPRSQLPVVEDTFGGISHRYNATTAVPQGLPALFQSATWSLCSGCQTGRKCLCRRHCSVVAVRNAFLG